MSRPPSAIKQKFQYFFSTHAKMMMGDMFFRLYIPIEDKIVESYDPEDWKRIFPFFDEDDLVELCDCVNVVILLWGDNRTEEVCGMLCFEEDYAVVGEVSFHGGTWNHDTKYYIEIFKSVIQIFDYILPCVNTITTTCGIGNLHADRFQQSLGFEEKDRDDTLIYKELNKEKFMCLPFRRRLKENKP